jgi:hypothetical protein
MGIQSMELVKGLVTKRLFSRKGLFFSKLHRARPDKCCFVYKGDFHVVKGNVQCGEPTLVKGVEVLWNK